MLETEWEYDGYFCSIQDAPLIVPPVVNHRAAGLIIFSLCAIVYKYGKNYDFEKIDKIGCKSKISGKTEKDCT